MRSDLYDEMYMLETTHWWHIHKRRLVTQLLAAYMPKRRTAKILDVGCGTGQLMTELSPYGTVYGIDTSSAAASYCKKRGLSRVRVGNASQKMPYTSNTFDAVVILDVLEHIKDDRATIGEVYRILKPGGIAIMTVPAYPILFSYWDRMLHHKRRYTMISLEKLIHHENFNIRKSSYVNMAILVPAVLMRIIKSFGRHTRSSSDFISLPAFLNDMVLAYLSMEDRLLLSAGLPFGLSVMSVVEKQT